jgi:hypothetical protein
MKSNYLSSVVFWVVMQDFSDFRGKTPECCSAGTLSAFSQEGNIFSIFCSTGERLLYFLKLALTDTAYREHLIHVKLLSPPVTCAEEWQVSGALATVSWTGRRRSSIGFTGFSHSLQLKLIFVSLSLHTYTHTHTHIYIYTHTHTHTHTHTYIPVIFFISTNIATL